MSKATETTVVKAVVAPKVKVYKVTLDDLKTRADELQLASAHISAMIRETKNSLLIPFLADVTMAHRTKVISDVRTFFVNAGFVSVDGFTKEEKDEVPLSLETVLIYQKDCVKWLNGAATKDDLPTSLTALHQGAPKVAQNITQKGELAKPFIKAAKGSSSVFRKDVSDGIWGKKDESKATRKKSTAKVNPTSTKVNNSDGMKAADNNQVAAWILAQVSLDELLRFRNMATKRIAVVRKLDKANAA
jgi:hypothetical protein